MTPMVRIQIQLTERQLETLRRASRATGRTIPSLVREGVNHYLFGRSAPRGEERIETAVRVSEKSSSGFTDVSAHHEREYGPAFGDDRT